MITNAGNWNEIIKFGGQAIFIVVGWIVVNKLSIKREKDKARNDIIVKSVDSLCDLIDRLFDSARTYHSKAERDRDAEVKMKMSIQDLSLRVASLQDLTGYIPSYIECQDDVIRLRQAITSNHFEDEHTGSAELNSEIFQRIAEASLAAKRNLITLKHRQFSIK